MSAREKGIAAERLAEDLGEQARAAENSRLNPATVFDLVARRAARPMDAVTIIQGIDAAIADLHSGVASWPLVHLKESHLVSAERSLVEIQRQLIFLRQFVSVDKPA